MSDHRTCLCADDAVVLQYLVPRSKAADLAPFLARLEQNRTHLGLKDAQMSLTSLEEVFLTIAKAAELEAAAAEGATKRTIPLSDGTLLEVSICGCALSLDFRTSMCA